MLGIDKVVDKEYGGNVFIKPIKICVFGGFLLLGVKGVQSSK